MNKKHYRKEFAKYTTLNVLGMLGLSCYILADTFFISNGLGADGLTALNLAIPVYSFVHGSGLMLGMGGATKYSIYKSQKKQNNMNLAFTNTLYMYGILALIFVLAGIFLSRQITTLVGADDAVFAMTHTYLKVILLFAPAFMLNDIFICFVRNDGSPRLAMTAMLAGSLSNIVLDYIFIFPLKMGIFGAVFATSLAPLISMGILSSYGRRKENQFHFIKTKPALAAGRSILSLGVPALITEVSSGIVIIVFNIIILGLLGNVGVAAYGIIANLSLVVISIYTGISQGIQPLLSRAHGTRDTANIKNLLRCAITTAAVLSCVFYLLINFFADPIAAVFNKEHNAQLQEIAISGLKLYFTAIPFAGFNIILSVYFTSTETPIPAHIISLLRGLFIIIPAAFLLAGLWGITGVWLAFPVTELLAAGFGWIIYLRHNRTLP